MGFPSPAADYEEQRISLDKFLIHRPTSTYFVKASETSYRDGVMKDARERLEEEDAVFGVVTYIINDARAGELDDCPVM